MALIVSSYEFYPIIGEEDCTREEDLTSLHYLFIRLSRPLSRYQEFDKVIEAHRSFVFNCIEFRRRSYESFTLRDLRIANLTPLRWALKHWLLDFL